MENQLRTLQKEHGEVVVKAQENEKEAISAKEQLKYHEAKGEKYENLYNDVAGKVDFAQNEYESMKSKLTELQRVYSDLKFEYDEAVETLAQANSARNKYYSENYMLQSRITAMKQQVEDSEHYVHKEKMRFDKLMKRFHTLEVEHEKLTMERNHIRKIGEVKQKGMEVKLDAVSKKLAKEEADLIPPLETWDLRYPDAAAYEEGVAQLIQEHEPAMLLWWFSKDDCPAGLITSLRQRFPWLKTVTHT